MQMKVVIPDGGIYADGVSYSAGTMVVRDMNTLRNRANSVLGALR